MDITITYDKKFDVLYIREKTGESTCGEENDNGVVELRKMNDNSFAGFIIYDFMKKIE